MSQLLKRRQAGVLCHISSLPSNTACGDLGVEAFKFVDFLQEIGATVWQTLPLNMTHADGSPYQCLSAHAGNPEFICLNALVEKQWLSANTLAHKTLSKQQLINQAYKNYLDNVDEVTEEVFKQFCIAQAFWLDDFALFLALRERFDFTGWFQWDDPYKNRDEAALKSATLLLAKEIGAIKFTQYLFFSQWLALKTYATLKNVALFGDIPIFVSYDSADVWCHPHLFKLDADQHMTVVAGVPPDYFSATGQRWGNPHYNWQAMQADGFAWWINRMQTQNALFDMVRIDHFRGLEAAWEIPASDETAINGYWVQAPGDALLAAIKLAFPNMTLIAEDLGVITSEVTALRDKYALPGMKILQFAFGGQDDNPYLPHNTEENSVVYTGTHDNNTSLGWYNATSEHERTYFEQYFAGFSSESIFKMPFSLVEMALSCKAQLAVIPMQDILELGTEHRMNIPGTALGNWGWRFEWKQLKVKQQKQIKAAIKKSQRT